ncbi:MAG TPA: pyridoxal 5'-phosphate synthase glutaminase subunit PdxT [Frankiaceae bacterium]|nr:pyridoxal 5'-phosphate synthase glutaminase subunit PdxT [Frankiaceae bacterium]
MSSSSNGARPTVGVLALQGDVREHLAALEVAGAQGVAVRRASELAALDGIVIPGGESTTIGRLLSVFGVLEPLREAVAEGLPTFGSCAGMILLATQILDGRDDQPLLGGLDITVRRNAFGRQVDSFETEVEVDGVPGGPVHAVFIRAPVVERTGENVRVLAEVAGRSVAVRDDRRLATAFHPELSGDARMHGMFVRIVKECR